MSFDKLIRSPILLDNSLKEIKILKTRKVSVTNKLVPVSNATITLDDVENGIEIRNFVKIFDSKGLLGIYRVSGLANQYTKEQQLKLEHGIVTLRDDIVVLAENVEKIEGNPEKILDSILAMQTGSVKWIKGNIDSNTNSLNISIDAAGNNLLEVLTSLAEELDEYKIIFDHSGSQWKIGIEKLSINANSVFRLSRNIVDSDISVSYDDSELCTRVKAGAAGYIEASTVNIWGKITNDLDIDDDVTEEDAKSYANKYLDQHKNPSMNIQLTAIKLKELTGESIDDFDVGYLSKVILPDYDTVINQRIVEIQISDLLNGYENQKVSLANRTKTLKKMLAAQEKENKSLRKQVTKNRRGGGGTKKKLEEVAERLNDAWIEIDRNKAEIALRAYSTTVEDINTRTSRVEVTLNGTETTIGLVAKVEENNNEISSAKIEINGVKSQITLKADKTVVDGILSTGLAGVGTLSANNVAGNKGNFDSLSINGNPVVSNTQTMVTSVTFPTYEEDTIYYKNHSNVNSSKLVLTPTKKIKGSYNTATIVYLAT